MTITLNEKTSGQYTATLKDETGNPVALANLSTLTITLYNVADDSIINSRNAQNVKNANNGTYGSTDGKFTMTFLAVDSPIVETAKSEERHRALFQATWTGGGGANWEVELLVLNLNKVT